jgi:hypothetical protein
VTSAGQRPVRPAHERPAVEPPAERNPIDAGPPTDAERAD